MATEQARKCATELVAVEEPTLDISALIEHRAEIIDRHFPDAGMIEKLREVLESLPFPERVPQWGIPDWQMAVEKAKEQARTALAGSETPARDERAWCCPQCHGKSYIIVNGVEVCGVCKPNEAPEAWAEGNTPREFHPDESVGASGYLLTYNEASPGAPPLPTVTVPLSPPEIAREIVAKSMLWNPVVDNVLGGMSLAAYASIKRKGLEDRIAAAIEKERKAASEAKLSVTKYAGRRIAELEAQEKQYEARLEETAHSVSVWQRSFGDAGKRISELKAALKKSEDSQREYFELNEGLQDDLKLQRQANKFNHDEHQQEKAELERQLQLERAKPDRDKQWREEALAIIAEQKRQLSPAPCGVKGHRQADVGPERRKAERRVDQQPSITGAMRRQQHQRRQRNLGPPCGRCIEVEKARSEALEGAEERLERLLKHVPELAKWSANLVTAIRGSRKPPTKKAVAPEGDLWADDERPPLDADDK